MNIKERFFRYDETKELDWQPEVVFEALPELCEATKDDTEQKFLDSALTPYIAKDLLEMRQAHIDIMKGLYNEMLSKDKEIYRHLWCILGLNVGMIILFLLSAL